MNPVTREVAARLARRYLRMRCAMVMPSTAEPNTGSMMTSVISQLTLNMIASDDPAKTSRPPMSVRPSTQSPTSWMSSRKRGHCRAR